MRFFRPVTAMLAAVTLGATALPAQAIAQPVAPGDELTAGNCVTGDALAAEILDVVLRESNLRQHTCRAYRK